MKIQREIVLPGEGQSFKLFSPSLKNFFYWHYHPEYELVYVEATAGILRDVFGFTQEGQENGRTRFRVAERLGGVVDLQADENAPSGRMGGGSVHHVAFRAADDAVPLQRPPGVGIA